MSDSNLIQLIKMCQEILFFLAGIVFAVCNCLFVKKKINGFEERNDFENKSSS